MNTKPIAFRIHGSSIRRTVQALKSYQQHLESYLSGLSQSGLTPAQLERLD